jgi:LuxR family maltose regulon positive regulatory protein
MGFYKEQEALVDARLLLAQDEAEKALSLLEDWLVDARANGRVISEMLIGVLTAQAQAALDNLPQACEALLQVLALGQPEGFRRLFLDEGEPLRALIWECRGEINHPKQQHLLDYVDRLLIAFPERIPGPGERGKFSDPESRIGKPNDTVSTLLEPLTEQEQRVLGLLGAGLTNLEIAEELVISLNTVKSHVKSIYRKLDVGSRREARRAARLLKLV